MTKSTKSTAAADVAKGREPKVSAKALAARDRALTAAAARAEQPDAEPVAESDPASTPTRHAAAPAAPTK